MQIRFLAERPQAIEQLAAWFVAEWPGYYANHSAADDLRQCLNPERLPIGLVAHEGADPLGVVALRERAITDLPEYSPGLGALYVAPAHRSQGIGTQLVRAAMRAAQRLGHRTLYAASASAGKIFERAGWEHSASILHRGQSLTLYRWRVAQ